MRFYGSLDNRLEEGRMFVDKIEVGTGVTEYSYSDRSPYEVTQVINQKHIFIRAMDYKRIDKNGMSDAQSYEFISNPEKPEIELVLKNNVWYKVVTYSKAKWETLASTDDSFKTPQVAYNYFKAMAGLTEKQNQKIEIGKEVRRYSKMNISIGVMDRHFDYCF